MIETIRKLADEVFPEVVRLRRHLHAHPELSFVEHATAEFVARTLTEAGLRVQTGVNGTGVVAELSGGAVRPWVVLRADMDALPIQEDTGLPFASTRPGCMHACGHDAHMASLLGAAMILARIGDRLPASVRFVFQPGEETAPGGATGMVREGVLEHASAAFALHVRPDLPTGHIAVRGGAFMASADELHITVRGQGGHAAEPHLLSSDAVHTTAQLVVALQSVISRNCPPDVPSVLSFGRMIADGASNVNPDSVTLAGTFRSMDETWRRHGLDRIRQVVSNTADAYGATIDCEIREGYPALRNDAATAREVAEAATAYLGADRVHEAELWFAGEDFAYFAEEVPACMYLLGVGNGRPAPGLHTPGLRIDEEALRTGSGFMAYLATTVT